MDTVKDSGDSQPVLVQKIAYCDVHAPAENSKLLDSAAYLEYRNRKAAYMPLLILSDFFFL